MTTLVETVYEKKMLIPDKAAVIYKDKQISYRELYDKAASMASVLNHCGIKSGDKVILEAISRPEYFVAYLAVQMLCAVTVPVDRGAKEEITQYIGNITEASLCICNGKKRGICKIEFTYQELEILSATEAEFTPQILTGMELVEIIFTTGSTGKPKGAMHTIAAINASMYNTKNGIGIQQEDIILVPLPLNHSFSLRVVRAAFLCGASIVLQNSAVSIKETADNIDRHHCTGMISVNTVMDFLFLHTDEETISRIFGQLRYIEFSAGALSIAMRKKLPKLLSNTEIHNTWGSSETGGCIFLNVSKETDKLTSLGKPIDTIEVALIDETGKALCNTGRQYVGKLALRGEMQMIGYCSNKKATEETIRNGWIVMNDLVWQDSDGYLYMIGRADDMINVGGEKVAPKEIEDIILDSGLIYECAVIGVPDEERVTGEMPILYYKGKNRADADEIRAYLSRRLPNYKIPKKYIPITAIPKNAMGKTDRKSLKDMYNKKISFPNKCVENILARRSIRKFLDKEVPDELISVLLKCGAVAPSGKNLKTRRFTVISSRAEIESFKELVNTAAERNEILVNGFNNPALLILISNDRRNADGIQDVSCSAENIMLAASSFGLGSVWLNPLMTICDDTEIRGRLNEYQIPQSHIVWSMLAIGWPATSGVKPEERGNAIHIVGGGNVGKEVL